MKVENVIDVLVLADKHNANQLKPAQEYHSLVIKALEATLAMHCMQLH